MFSFFFSHASTRSLFFFFPDFFLSSPNAKKGRKNRRAPPHWLSRAGLLLRRPKRRAGKDGWGRGHASRGGGRLTLSPEGATEHADRARRRCSAGLFFCALLSPPPLCPHGDAGGAGSLATRRHTRSLRAHGATAGTGSRRRGGAFFFPDPAFAVRRGKRKKKEKPTPEKAHQEKKREKMKGRTRTKTRCRIYIYIYVCAYVHIYSLLRVHRRRATELDTPVRHWKKENKRQEEKTTGRVNSRGTGAGRRGDGASCGGGACVAEGPARRKSARRRPAGR